MIIGDDFEQSSAISLSPERLGDRPPSTLYHIYKEMNEA